MAENKKTFVFYSDWRNMINEMPNNDAGELLKHILSYVNDESPTTENILVKMAFGHMKPLLKADLVKWEELRKKRSEYGKKGGQAKAKQKLSKPEQPEAVNGNVNDNATVNVSDTDNVIQGEDDVLEVEILDSFPFDQFWNVYNKKNDKKYCAEKWEKLTEKDREAIMRVVYDYVEATPDAQFRKNPKTFLNQRSWEDEGLCLTKKTLQDGEQSTDDIIAQRKYAN